IINVVYLSGDCPQITVRTFVRRRRSTERPGVPQVACLFYWFLPLDLPDLAQHSSPRHNVYRVRKIPKKGC
ncbi:MAG TPA: hypothetical protein PKY35_14545, partial [Candidatus Hydrogenedentes bacterium]|nr:hypothetical protein [Candidatus Hydrogenedentota bacterium]